MSYKYKIGERVVVAYGAARIKGKIATRRNAVYGNQYRLHWDLHEMSRTFWVDEWDLRLVPALEQLAEQAK